jgi:site-specific DNA-methyltransferase (adenine-specific)
MTFTIHNGNCIDVMRSMPDNSVDSIVTDPPYELNFMGSKWDNTGIAFNVEVWTEALRVLKPGGHLLAFSGSRTYHRMAVAIEDARFQIRDQIMWIYGSGFPKSLDVSKAIQKASGVEPVGFKENKDGKMLGEAWNKTPRQLFMPPLEGEAQQWAGWGTALKPAHEPIVLARKPLIGTVAANVLEHGTGGLNIDGSRVGSDGGTKASETFADSESVTAYGNGLNGKKKAVALNAGRFPANIIHDGSDEVGELLGEPARFFYCAKASKSDRSDGNNHPTVKPSELMRYLCRLITPPNGIVLDPFMGSGSTGKGAILEGFDFIGMELDPEYVEIAKSRIEYAQKEYKQNLSQQIKHLPKTCKRNIKTNYTTYKQLIQNLSET